MDQGGLAQPRQGLRARERHARILAALETTASLAVAELAGQLAVSEMTIRRDLRTLELSGRLTRVHGGATGVEATASVGMDREEPAFAVRLRKNHAAKLAIASAAADLISDLRAVALDTGTTACLIAERLRDQPLPRRATPSSVFTNSLPAAQALSQSACEVYVPGGRVRPIELSIVGPAAAAELEALWFDAAVVGVSGITADGLFDYSLEDTTLKRVYLRRAELKIVLCDASKFERMSLVNIAPLSAFDLLITNARPPARLGDALLKARVEVRIAPPVPGSSKAAGHCQPDRSPQ